MSTADLGEAVTARLAELGWSRSHLAEVADLSTETVGRLTAGTNAPFTATRRKVEQALGWTPGTALALVAGEVLPEPGPADIGPHLDAIFRLHHASTPRERVAVLVRLLDEHIDRALGE